MPQFTYHFTVVGRGPFPIDLLRRKECFPADRTASQEIAASLGPSTNLEIRRVALVHLDDRPEWSPVSARWEDQGWQVASWDRDP